MIVPSAAHEAGSLVTSDATISRLMVQNILHPGLSEVYNELLTAGSGNELYIRDGEALTGMTLGPPQWPASRP